MVNGALTTDRLPSPLQVPRVREVPVSLLQRGQQPQRIRTQQL